MDRCVASAENPAVNPVNPVNRGNPVGALRIAIVGAGVSGLVAAAVFAVPTVALWRARARFGATTRAGD